MNDPRPSPRRAPESFWDHRERFRELVRVRWGLEVSSAEPEGEYGAPSGLTPLDERLVQAIWANQLMIGEGLRLADGRSVRVLDPGRWNGAAGPDFRDARLAIDGEERRGDVEIHLDASEWRRHGHEGDLDYNGVIAHVVLRNDDGALDDRLHGGSRAPRLELEPYLFPDLDTIRRSMTPDDYPYERPSGLGKCYEMMADAEPDLVASFLDRAGDERLTAKVRRLAEQMRGGDDDLEQVFHQATLTALGAGSGRTLYYLLAKRAPIREMIDHVGELPSSDRELGFETILLHVAGLVPTDAELADAPVESIEHVARLRALWRRFEPYWSDRPIAPTRRWYRGIRPVNFPCRRLSAVSRLLARAMDRGVLPFEDLSRRARSWLRDLKDLRPAKKAHPAILSLMGWFEPPEPPGPPGFWESRYSFTARPSEKRMALIGESAARSLAFNAAVPMLALAGRRAADEELASAAARLYAAFPPLQPNHVTEFMRRRLFGDDGKAGRNGPAIVNTERRNQGLFQIFYSCCNGEERHCERCYYLLER